MQFVIDHSYLIPLLPLLGAVVAGFFGDRFLGGKAHWPIWIGVGCSALLSMILLIGMTHAAGKLPAGEPVHYSKIVYTWINAGSFRADFGFYFDPLTAVMLMVVTGIGLLITIFAAGYMNGEEGYSRFFAYLGLFIFSMTCLVMGENLLMLYLGWEGVGVCSYLLIGYYYQRPAAAAAATKAFVVNRVGDFGFAVGIMLCFWAFHGVSFYGTGAGTGILDTARDVWIKNNTSLTNLNPTESNIVWGLRLIPFMLMLGAFGKSAQFPLYVWLPDAMEGPTPVSALIHAATMVTAGVYMIARCGTLFVTNQYALWTIAGVGAFTALFAATIALRQFDLKKVFAYSTVSQLGYMFVAVGILAPTAAVFHLVTHAFFKALLFLGSGVVMHAMLGHLDMRKMSGLAKKMPWTNRVMLVGCLALAGCPLFSGFFSKDQIVGQALEHNAVLGLVLLTTSFLTAYYTFRLYFQVFQGPLVVPTTGADDHAIVGTRDPAGATAHAEAKASHEAVMHGNVATSGVDHAAADHAHDHEPWVMMGPLMILAVGAIFVGWVYFKGSQISHFLGHSPSFSLACEMAVKRYNHVGELNVTPSMFGQPDRDESTDWSAMLIGTAVFGAGAGLAWLLHLRNRAMADRIAAGVKPLTSLLEGKYWVDELYDRAVVRPLHGIGKAFFAFDRIVVDTAVWVVSLVPQLSGIGVKLTMQRGYLQGYAAAMLFGVLAILLMVFL